MIRVQAGLTRKRGLPRFSSAQASCSIDTEVEGPWPPCPERLIETIRGLYQLCAAAVEEELDRIEVDARRAEDPLARPASPAQLRALQSLAQRKRVDLTVFLARHLGTQPSELTSRQASHAIDLLARFSGSRVSGRSFSGSQAAGSPASRSSPSGSFMAPPRRPAPATDPEHDPGTVQVTAASEAHEPGPAVVAEHAS